MADRISSIRPIIRLLAGPLLLTLAAGTLKAQTAADTVAHSPIVITPPPRQLAVLRLPIHPRVAPSPDGRLIAVLQTRPDPVLWIVPVDGREPFALRQNWAAYHPRWSPAGDRIGFIAGIGPPRIWTVEVDPESGRPVDPPRLLIRTNANAFAFSPDGGRVALVSARSTAAGASEIHIVDWESRRTRSLLREDGIIYRLDWSPDGEFLYYGLAATAPSDDERHTIVRAHPANGVTERMARVGEFLGLSADGSRLLYRPVDQGDGRAEAFELSDRHTKPLLRLTLPPGPAPQWGADPGSLLQVLPVQGGNVILEIPLGLEGPSGT
jgi:dipeptidyl aminopeptidase/acylaminoacyl peptidase